MPQLEVQRESFGKLGLDRWRPYNRNALGGGILLFHRCQFRSEHEDPMEVLNVGSMRIATP